MRICFVPTFQLPWCATSWRRALEFGKAVSKYNQVTFLCPEVAVPKLKAMTKDVDTGIVPVKMTSNGYLSKGLARVLALGKYDIVHTFKPMPDIFPAGFAAKFKGCKWIADLDDLEGSQGFNRNSPLWKRKLMDFFEWLVPASADAVTVASQELLQFYKKFDPFYIPNGADPAIFQPLERPNNKPTVLFMGFFHPDIIDADMVIRAAGVVSKKHGMQLLMVGDGDDRTKAEELAKELNIDVSFTGHIKNVPSVIGSADIGVISFRDNMLNRCKCPLRLYEYMSCGLPIVSTRVGEPAYVLKDGAGLLVDPDVESLAQGLLALIENRDLANKMGRRGHELVLKEYNWEALGDKLLIFYEEIMKSQNKSY